MITANINATTLEEFYDQIVAAQQAAHGRLYTSHHTEIQRRAKPTMTYRELGVNQGGTLACAILAGYKSVTGIDHRDSTYLPFLPLFQEGANRHYVDLRLLKQDSRLPMEDYVDFLLIDSKHERRHLREELRVHGPKVNQYILAHDTATVPELHVELEDFARREGWQVALRSLDGVGHTLLQR